MDDVAWAALTLSLTLALGLYTYLAYRRRGLAAGLQGAGLTLLPLAAYLTETLRMFTRVVDAVTDWATSLVFSPTVWLGVLVAGVAVLLLGAARVVGRRTAPRAAALPASREKRATSGRKRASAAPSASSASVDDEMAEIEALLRKRGIS